MKLRAFRKTLLLPAAGLGLMLTAGGTARAQQPPIYAFTSQLANNTVRAVDVVNRGDVGLVTDANSCTFLAPRLVVASPDGKYVFVSNSAQSQYVCPIRVSDRKVLPGLWLGGGFAPYSMKVTPDSKYLYIASLFRLIVFDLQGQVPPSGSPTTGSQWTRNEPLNVIPGEFNLDNFGIAIAPDMSLFYVATRFTNFATGLQTSRILAFRNAESYPTVGPAASLRAAVTAPFAMSGAELMLFRRDGTRAFTARDGGSIGWVIDAANDTILTPGVNFPASISDLQIRPDGNFIYATKGSAAQLFELNSQTLQHVRTLDMFMPAQGETQGSFLAFGVSFRADSSQAAVALNAANSQVRTYRFSDGSVISLASLNSMGVNKIAVGEPLEAPDTTPPLFTTPLVAGANVGVYSNPATTVFSFSDANQLVSKVSAQDPESGLANPTLYAAFSTDGGATFSQQTTSIFSPDGSTAVETVYSPAVSPFAPLNAVQSWGNDPTAAQRRNVIRFQISNKANTASPFFDVPVAVNINPFRAPTLSSPADGAAIAAAQATLTWAPHPDIPIQAVAASQVKILAAPTCSTVVQTIDVPTPVLTTQVSLPPGRYCWRVRTLDNFGPASYSPYSAARSFTLDDVAPELSIPRVAVAGSGVYQDPALISFATLQVDARATAQDIVSGLAKASVRVDLSVNGGAAFVQVPAPSITVSGSEGSTNAEQITVSGLTLAHSLSPTQMQNVIRYQISDKAGNASPQFDVPVTVNLNPTTAPSTVSPLSNVRLPSATVELRWALHTNVPMGAIQSFRVEVAPTSDYVGGLQFQVVSAPNTSAIFTLGPGFYNWRVKAIDRFGLESPYSSPDPVFLVDTTPPIISRPTFEVAVAGSGSYQPLVGAISYFSADGRVKVQDSESGLDAASRVAELSTDGGQNFSPLPSLTLSGINGSISQETLTASSLNLVHSLSNTEPRNQLRFKIKNRAGGEGVEIFDLFVNRNTVTPPTLVAPAAGAALAAQSVRFEWALDSQVPLAAIDSFELQVARDEAFTDIAVQRTIAAPTLFKDETLAAGVYHWRVRAIDKVTPAAPSPYAVRTFSYAIPPLVQILSPLDGAIVNDPRSRLIAEFTRGSADLDLANLNLRLDLESVTPVLDEEFGPMGSNGLIESESQPVAASSKGQLVAVGGYAYLIAGNQDGNATSPLVRKSAIQGDGSLGAWSQVSAPLPQGLSRPAAVATGGRIYVMGGRNDADTVSTVYVGQPDSYGDITQWILSSENRISGRQGGVGVVVKREDSFLFMIGGEGQSGTYADPVDLVQFARINADGTLGSWANTTPLPIRLSAPSSFAWHGRIYVLGGGTALYPSEYSQSRKVFSAVVDRSGNLGPWQEHPIALLPVPYESNPHPAIFSGGKKELKFSAPILFQDGQLLYFNGPSVYWSTINSDGSVAPWQLSPNSNLAPRQFGAGVAHKGFGYVAGGWTGSVYDTAVRRTAFNTGQRQKVTATFIPDSDLSPAPHSVQASIADVNGLTSNDSNAFQVSASGPSTISSGLGKLTSYVAMTITPVEPQTLPTPTGVALQAGLSIPAGLKIYEIAPHSTFDSAATIELGWTDANSDGIVDGTSVSEGALSIYKYNGQAWVPVTEIARNNQDNYIRGRLYSASHFALLYLESVPPLVTGISPVHGSTGPAGAGTTIAASFTDDTGVFTAGVRVYLDGLNITDQAQITPSNSFSFVTANPLSDGIHSLSLTVPDVVGNYAHVGSIFSIDGTAPATTLVMTGGRQASSPSPDSLYASSCQWSLKIHPLRSLNIHPSDLPFLDAAVSVSRSSFAVKPLLALASNPARFFSLSR